LELIINPHGVVSTIYSEEIDLTAIGRATIHRASHVEPTADGTWTADLSPVGGPVLGPFGKRSEALAAEANWLTDYLLALRTT
jgi:hypothetical protein